MDEARERYRSAYDSGDLWAAPKLAKLLPPAAAITILEGVAAQSPEIGKWALYDAARLREHRGADEDLIKALIDHAAAYRLGNSWSTIPLAYAAASGKSTGIKSGNLAATMERYLEEGDADYLIHGRNALAALYYSVLGCEERGAELLADVAATGGEEGAKAASQLAERKSQADPTDANAIAALESGAKAGIPGSMFALGRHLAMTATDAAERQRGVTLIKAAVAIEPDRASYGFYLVGDALATGDKADLAGSAEAYAKSAATGNGWAQMRLTFAYRDGRGVKKSSAKAAQFARQALASDSPQSGLIAILSLYGTPADPSSDRLVAALRATLASTQAVVVADALEGVDVNQRAKLLQSIWRQRGLFAGQADGIIGRESYRIFVSECRRRGVSACRTEFLPPDLLRATILHLANTRSGGNGDIASSPLTRKPNDARQCHASI
ncbi:MAG TPA: hypothetical protein ENH55_23345 [Aurantimonas coralicida]|uniref:Sel1 repeat family protein n=1 Tax=Aurantimonas coralicida TaxID=182270 RepID=A0A9C9NEH6_9HYPH|nr:hypothetical protein [Aurantimonas coralicida]HEU00141.1 hypothetical protein [Aurantimonas coralicida]